MRFDLRNGGASCRIAFETFCNQVARILVEQVQELERVRLGIDYPVLLAIPISKWVLEANQFLVDRWKQEGLTKPMSI